MLIHTSNRKVFLLSDIVPKCPQPPVVYNSISKQTGEYIGDIITYSCKAGYKMSVGGTHRAITCLNTLTWSLTDDILCEGNFVDVFGMTCNH